MPDPTPEQLQAQADAINTVAGLLPNLVGPAFDGKSAYYSDENFIVDYAAADGDAHVLHVYLVDGDNPPILVLSPDGYRAGMWLSKLQDKASALASTWPPPPSPSPAADWQPIDDSNLFQG